MRGLISIFLVSISLTLQANEIQEAIVKLKSLNAMREGLSSTLDQSKEQITEETFKRVCMPVGMQLKSWGAEQGYQVRQIAEKYRNPQHKPQANEAEIISLFQKEPSKFTHEVVITDPEQKGTRLYVRIPVVSSCLHCHGPKESRPDFIKNKYQEDKAYDFKIGDLRGLYSVFISNNKISKEN